MMKEKEEVKQGNIIIVENKLAEEYDRSMSEFLRHAVEDIPDSSIYTTVDKYIKNTNPYILRQIILIMKYKICYMSYKWSRCLMKRFFENNIEMFRRLDVDEREYIKNYTYFGRSMRLKMYIRYKSYWKDEHIHKKNLIDSDIWCKGCPIVFRSCIMKPSYLNII